MLEKRLAQNGGTGYTVMWEGGDGMFPVKEFEKRFAEILSDLDALAEAEPSDALEELNAELEDTLFLLAQLDPEDADGREELEDTLEALEALAEDYEALADAIDGVGALARRLSMTVGMERENLSR